VRIFVYGTLKAGGRNAGLCGESAAREPATVPGRLHEHPMGHPFLVVPSSLVMARGTASAVRDAALEDAVASEREGAPALPSAWPAGWEGRWLPVRGELVTLAEPARLLPPLDALEGFVGGVAVDYERVLLPVRVDAGLVAAWAWVAPGGRPSQDCRPLEADSWPPSSRRG